MVNRSDIPLSVLDLAPVREGSTVGEALRQSLELARHVEALGYHRFWVAEHHNMPGIASAATSVVIAHVAGGTERIRVGSGGIMLFNHSPLLIAEQFGTLDALFPGRIDLGLGRAPGTDQPTMRVLRRGLGFTGDEFPELLAELRKFLAPASPGQMIRAVPGAGANVPIWLLGSGGFSAQLAGQLGLPFAFAGHFSPDSMRHGLELYHRSFRPSDVLSEPYAMLGVNVFAAETDEEAERLSTSHAQSILNLVRGVPGMLPPPVDSMDGLWSPHEQAAVANFMRGSIAGRPERVRDALTALVKDTGISELMIHSMIYDPAARRRSYEIVAEVWK